MNKAINNPLCETWGIKRLGNGRYILIDTVSGNVLYDCQGLGFKTYNKAYTYGYNKYHSKGECVGKPNKDDLNKLF